MLSLCMGAGYLVKTLDIHYLLPFYHDNHLIEESADISFIVPLLKYGCFCSMF